MNSKIPLVPGPVTYQSFLKWNPGSRKQKGSLEAEAIVRIVERDLIATWFWRSPDFTLPSNMKY